jgi:hypothetical protein
MKRAGLAALLVLVQVSAVRAADFKVPIEYPTIQAAIDAAAAAPGNNRVMVASGRYVERLQVHGPVTAESLEVVGGFNLAYDEPPSDRTLLDGGGVGPVVTVTGEGLELFTLLRFIIVDGNEPESPDGRPPGAIYVSIAGDSEVELRENIIKDHRLRSDRGGPTSPVLLFLRDNASILLRGNEVIDNKVVGPGASGGGVKGVARGSSFLNLENNRILRNVVRATDCRERAQAGGADFLALDSAKVRVNRVRFEGNRARAGGAARYAALIAASRGGGRVEVSQNQFIANVTESDGGDASGTVLVSATASAPGARSTASVQRETFRGNVAGRRGYVVHIKGKTGDVLFSDSLIAGSKGGGVSVKARAGAQVWLTNLTVADNDGRALRVDRSPTAATYLSNTILFDNGHDTPAGSLLQTANLVGLDPLFVDPAGGDYTVQSGSPAIDAGNGMPPGGLGGSALVGPDRELGAAVDIGAHERAP